MLGAGLALVSAAAPAGLFAQALTLVRFDVASRAAVDSVRRLGIDIVEVHPAARGRVQLAAVITTRDRQSLASRGWLVDDVPRPPAALAAFRARSFTVYRDFDDPVRGVAAWLRGFAQAHANVTLDSIGASVEGRPILAAKIGAATDDPARPNVLFMATYHAREWASTELALRLISYLADSLPLRPGGAALLASRDVWVIPVANPDGYEYTFTTERLWRKNRRPNGGGSSGVDLNRNHAGTWGFDDRGSSPTPASETYRGQAAESEPETQAIVHFHQLHPPAASITYHTYTGAVLYPWSQADGLFTGDDAVFRALAGSDLAPSVRDSLSGSTLAYYHPGPGWQLYPTNGEYTGWAYAAYGTIAFTVEATAGCCAAGAYYGFDFPDDELMLRRVFQDNLPFALELLSTAGNPALLANPAGPAAGPQLESVWPEVRALVTAPGGASVDVATDSGLVRSQAMTPDPLGAGRRFTRIVATGGAVLDARAVRVASAGLTEEILARDGAELPTTAWRGFTRVSPGFQSGFAWSGFTDTLVSPVMVVSGRGALTLFFWTRHGGSIFDQASRGSVQVSVNGGASWSTVAEVVGSANAWYPLAVPLDAVALGAHDLRVRFIARQMGWMIDWVALGSADGGVARLFAPALARQSPSINVSQNPVTAPPVTLHWAAAAGTARVEVYSLTGVHVTSADLPNDPGRWQWDLTADTGRPVANGAYFIVLTLGDNTRLRRRLLVAR